MSSQVCKALALALLIAGLSPSGATDYYVSTQGNDSNPGTSAKPFRTITRAYNLAGPGTTIIVRSGVYTDYTIGWGLRLGRNGTASSPIVLRSEVRGGAAIDGLNGADRNKAVYLDGSYNVIDGFEIRGGPSGGITVWGNDNQIRNNEIHHNGNQPTSSTYGRDGVYSDRSTRNNTYWANYIHDNGRSGSGGNLDHGLYLCGDNEVAANNVLVRNTGSGIQVAGYNTVSNLKVYNNVMAYNGTQGIILWMALDGVDIKNNIFLGNATYGINSYDAHGGGVVIDRNLVYGNSLGSYALARGGSDFSYSLGTTISSAPLFLDSTIAGFDAHLATGSPAIGSGLNLSAMFTTDMDGAARPSSGPWDLGAYLHVVTDTIPPTVALTSPAGGTTVSGLSVAVSANASDNVGVVGVQFKLNGANLGAEDTAAPYGVTLNTTALVNGTHTLTAVARDAAGNQTAASTISVTVNNNTAPTISSLANMSINAGGSTGALAFTVGDAETPAGSLIVSGGSSNSTLVPGRAIVFSGSGANRTVAISPAAFLTGTATITVTVSDGSLSRSTSFVLTVNALPAPVISLTSPASGAEFVAPAAIGLAASVNANGNLITKVQFHAGALLLGEDTTAPYNWPWNSVAAGSYSVRATAIYNAGSSVVSALANVLVASAPPSTGLTLDSTSGSLSAPFVAQGGIVSQPAYTSSPSAGGRASYTFNLSTAGDYVISAVVNAPNDGANSFFVNIDAEPADPVMIWDIPVTSGLVERTVSWRGNGTPADNELAPKVFTLAAGAHQLIVRGREGGCGLGTITIQPHGTAVPPAIVLTSPMTGANYVAPAAIDLAASVNPNGHAITKVQFHQGTTLIGEDAFAPYLFSWSGVLAGSHNLSARAVYAGTNASSPVVNVTVTTAPTDPGLTIAATLGTIASPFVAASGAISQPSYTSVTAGGRATYNFNLPVAGDYTITALVNAPDDSANSFFVNIDGEPADPTMIWDIPVTTGVEPRLVAWRGNGTPTSSQFTPKVFPLAAGNHQLVVRGREGNTRVESFTITREPVVQAASTGSPTAPALRITVTNGQTQVSWPADSNSFLLQSRSEYSSDSIWTDVADLPVVVGEDQVVTMPFSMDNCLYRLRAR